MLGSLTRLGVGLFLLFQNQVELFLTSFALRDGEGCCVSFSKALGHNSRRFLQWTKRMTTSG